MIDERARHDLYRALEELLGTKAADTLMSLVPPVGPADVATQHDVHRLEARLDARLGRARGWAEARFAGIDVRFEGLDGRFSRVDAQFTQLERHLDRSIREQTRTLLLAVLGALFTVSLCLGAVALAL